MNPLLTKIAIYLCLAAGLLWGVRPRLTGQPAGEADTWIVLGCFAAAALLSLLYRFGAKKD